MKKLLVAVDLQNDFISGSLGSDGAKGIVKKASQIIKDFDGDIVATKDTHFDNYLSTKEGSFLPVVHCIKGTKGWEFDDEIKKALDTHKYTVIEKNTFGSTDLVDYIRENCGEEVPEITFIGLCTDICVVSNVLLVKAFFPESRIIVDKSACFGVTEEKHNWAIETMKSCHIEITGE